MLGWLLPLLRRAAALLPLLLNRLRAPRRLLDGLLLRLRLRLRLCTLALSLNGPLLRRVRTIRGCLFRCRG